MIIVECPHCKQSIEILAINCRIFRCGIYKANYKQIDPHLPKAECDRVFAEGLIFGCGKPFIITVIDASTVKLEPCDYI